MSTIARLFGKSPFSPLQTHMSKVRACIDKLSSLFATPGSKNHAALEPLVAQLCKLEHEADLTKNDIRNHFPKSIFLPIERGHFLEILAKQDSIADKAEEIGILLTLRPLEPFDSLEGDIHLFLKKNTATFASACQIIQEIDELLEASFGGIEAERVKSMVEETAHLEYEAKTMGRTLMKKLFSSKAAELSPAGFYLWLKLIEEIGAISTLSEKLANRIRMVLELK